MKTYTAGRGSGKTMLCVSKAAGFVRNGLEVYYICPTAKHIEFAKKQMEKFEGKTVADKVHFLTFDKLTKPGVLNGINKRRSSKVIFDDLDQSLSNLVTSRLGAYSEIELATCTENWMEKKEGGKR